MENQPKRLMMLSGSSDAAGFPNPELWIYEQKDVSGIVHWSCVYSAEPEYGLSVDFIIRDEMGEEEIRGSIKWDGCMNFETAGLYHLCDPGDTETLAFKLEKVWPLALALMPNADENYPKG